MGVRVVMLTGDNERTAKAIGKQAGVDEVIAGVLPEGKELEIRKLKAQGKTAIQILEENMTGVQVLDLSGCSLDAVLYYVNQDIPVLAILEDGEAVLVTGFNEFNVVIMEPATGKLYKKGMNDATAWFAENGNHFITYMRTEN